MADLYNTETYEYEQLCKKHGSFAVPSYKIVIKGKNIADDLGFFADNIVVTQTIKAKSGSCRFEIINAYDLKSGSFRNGFDEAFPLGAKAEAFLGYKIPALVFKGFVADVSFSFDEDEPPKVVVSCFDIRMLMLQGRKNVVLDKAPFDTVVEQLLAYYSSFIEFQNSGKQKHNKDENFNQFARDFDYINDYATARGQSFFVLGDKAYLQEIYAVKEPLITLNMGESLISFSCNYSYNAVSVEGTLVDYPQGEPITETAETAKPAYSQLQVTSKPLTVRLDASRAKNSEDLKIIVQNEARQREDSARSGRAKCIGMPELIPARFIKLGKTDKKILDGKFFVSEVVHEFSANGYICVLDFSSASSGGQADAILDGAAKNGDGFPCVALRKVLDNNYDEEHPACVKLDIPGQEGKTDWIRVVMPFAGKGNGFYLMPEINDEVAVVYCDGDINKPIVLGGLYGKEVKPPEGAHNEENNIKLFKTKSGHIVKFDDTADKTAVEIITAAELSVKLDDGEQTIILSDSKGENKIIVNEKDGEISFAAKNKITLTGGSSVLVLDGSGKKAELKSDTVELKPTNALNLGGQQMKIEGQQIKIKGQAVNIEAGGQLEIKSSGVASLKGSMVKIN